MAKKLSHLAAQLEGLKATIPERTRTVQGLFKKHALFMGYTKVYEPYSTEGDKALTIPPDNQIVQLRVREVLRSLFNDEGQLIDKIYQQDLGNAKAVADIVIGDQTLAKAVPVTSLIHVYNKMKKLRADFIMDIPTPDPSVQWTFDKNSNQLVSVEEKVTQKTMKKPQTLVKFPATKEHPAQTERYDQDVPVGEFRIRQFSGAERADIKAAMLNRFDELIAAIKLAVETANMSVDVPEVTLADKLFDYVVQPMEAAYSTN